MQQQLSFNFHGRNVLVTGGSRGIGFAVAKSFAQANANVWILAEDAGVRTAAQTIAGECQRAVTPLHCDIADCGAVAQALEEIPSIDVLINNAGYQPRTPMTPPDDSTDREFRRVIEVNVMGTYYVTRYSLPKMGKGGRIVFTSSIWGKTGAAEYGGYCASKHSTIGFMRSLALDLGPVGITVNAICPGWVDTEGAMWTVRELATNEGKSVEDLIEQYTLRQPLPGIMCTDDLVGTYLFLASDVAKDITGQAINVDRGILVG